MGMGAAVATAGLTTSASSVQAQDKPVAPLKVIDFHNHFGGPFTLTTADRIKIPAAREAQLKTNALLRDPAALLASLEQTGCSARVINIPTAFLEDADGNVAKDTTKRINDYVAELAGKNKGKIYSLATVDAFSGDEGARELTRAVRDLGLRGVFLESGKGDLLLNAPEARPTLAVAAQLGIPIFVHPVQDRQMHARFSKTGPLGARLARATINSASLLAMLEGGVFDELPQLKVVVTTLAIGGVLMAGGFGDGRRIRRDTPEQFRRHVYIDTMGLHPALVSSVVDLLGADHVLAGTDWPIAVEKEVPARLQKALAVAGLDAAGQQMVASGNALKLLGAS